MAQTPSYYDEQQIEITKKTRELLTELPPYVTAFFRGRKNKMTAKTRLSYAYDLKVFFTFLLSYNPILKGKRIKDVSLDILDRLELHDFEEFQNYLEYYIDPFTGAENKNSPVGIARKLATVRSLYTYLYRHNMISRNEASKVELPDTEDRDIIRLDPNEVAELLDYVETCKDQLTQHEQKYYKKTAARDLAILTLLLGTGLRVSECVGINFDDIDLKNNAVRVTRKGDKVMTIYFSDEVHDALENYLEIRDRMETVEGHEQALFLSMQRKRISVDAVEDIVKKYVKKISPLKHITPHKLRSTYGSTLYAETGDIYLVAAVLGHNDVNTTKKHYAAMSEDRRRLAGNKVKLRED